MLTKLVYYNLRNYTSVVTLIFYLGLLVLMCSCSSNKTSRVGTAMGNAAVGSIPNSAASTVNGATTTAISGGKVLQGAGRGAAGGVGSAAGSVVGSAIRELLK